MQTLIPSTSSPSNPRLFGGSVYAGRMHFALWIVAAALLSGEHVHGRHPTPRSYSSHDYYVLEHDPAGGATLDDCASTLGLEVVEQAGELQNHWLLRVPHSQLPPRDVKEDVILAPEAVAVLTTMAVQTTLRYALNIISTGQVLARKRKSDRVQVEDLRRSYTYFMDEKRSVQWLKEQQGSLVFEEIGGPADHDAMDQT